MSDISFGELREQVKTALYKNSNLISISDNSVLMSIIDAVLAQVSTVYEKAYGINELTTISKATGQYLDLLGNGFYGLQRGSATSLYFSASDRVFKFYVSSGTLSTILPRKYIPKDTTITNSTGTCEYRVVEDVPFADDAVSVFVPAASLVQGTSCNVAATDLNQHSLNLSALKVTNTREISEGVNLESDTLYRSRLVNWAWAARSGNRRSVLSEILALPDVSDVRLNINNNGPATFNIVVIPTRGRLSEGSRLSLESILSEIVSLGIIYFLMEPVYVSLKIKVQLKFDSNTSYEQQLNIKTSTENDIKTYIENIPLGGQLITSQILRQALASTEVVDAKITCLLINGESFLIQNQQLLPEEIYVLDEEQEFPIEVV